MKKKKHAVSLSSGLQELLCRAAGLQGELGRNSKVLPALAQAVKQLSDGYIEPERCCWSALYENPGALRAYLAYYLPVNLVKIFPLLDELASGGAFNPLQREHLSVLDIGCGPGTFSLGLLEYISSRHGPESSLKKIALTGIERNPKNTAAAADLIRAYAGLNVFSGGIEVKASFRQASVNAPDFLSSAGLYDLIIAGNVIAELRDEGLAGFLAALADHLAPGGALIIIDPGTRRAARRLLHVRQLLLEGTELSLYGPCLSAAACPLQGAEGQWCHEKLFWQPPEAVRQIDLLLGFSKEKGIKYSYLTFLQQRSNRLSRYAAIAEKNIWRVASYLIHNKGEARLWVCNGRERLQLRLLERNRSETNCDFSQAERGELAFVDGTTARAAFQDMPKRAVFKIISRHPCAKASQSSVGPKQEL